VRGCDSVGVRVGRAATWTVVQWGSGLVVGWNWPCGRCDASVPSGLQGPRHPAGPVRRRGRSRAWCIRAGLSPRLASFYAGLDDLEAALRSMGDDRAPN